MQQSPKLAVVILHYADPTVTQRVHRQLLGSDPDFADSIFVLDNHSPQPYPNAWMRTERNLYWGGAFQFCLDHFAARGFSHLWFCNNDILFVSKPPHIWKAWQRLLTLNSRLAHSGPVGVYSPATSANRYHPQMLVDERMQFRRVRIVDGIAPLCDIAAVQRVGGLDAADNPVGYSVDSWLSRRLDESGFPLVVDHQVVVRHAFHKSAGGDDRYWKLAHATQEAFLRRTFGTDAADAKARIDELKADFTDLERMPAPESADRSD